MARKTSVGGQALMEGVMMRGAKGTAIAVRKGNGEITIDYNTNIPFAKKYSIFKLPFIRGAVNLIDSLITGINSLNFSYEFIEDEEEEEPSKFELLLNKIFKDKTEEIMVGFSLVIAMFLAVLLFMIIPTALTSLLKMAGVEGNGLLSFIEGTLSFTMFLTYMYLISKLEDMKRVFMYHGAEHKSIFCYENEEDLTVENVRKQSRFHPRCGTNFMFLVMAVSIFLFSFITFGNLVERMVYKILLLPLVSGITYELIKWLGNTKTFIGRIIAFPGLALQKLSTKEPDDSMIEVAIAALEVAEGIKTKKQVEEMYRVKEKKKEENTEKFKKKEEIKITNSNEYEEKEKIEIKEIDKGEI